MGTVKNYVLLLKLSKEEVIKKIKELDNFTVGFEREIRENVYMIFLLKEFIRIVVNGIISISILINEKEVELCEVTITVHNPVSSEGLLNDLNVGKTTRKQLLEQFDKYLINIEELT